ncbi:hypothetical protein [Ectobacillus polymachus]|uniref:hypothetical protein n=1 Tax=Ectobacillus polymachus TaxID=1508806 RepID=UPI003A8B820C
MPKYDYLLLHTERKFVRERCKIIRKVDGEWVNEEIEETVIIPTDPPPPNIDPYVFHQPWFYGYCRNANTPQDTAKQSIFIFCTFSQRRIALLVDTVFVVKQKYAWLGQSDGFQPSRNFRDNYPYKESDSLYKEFIAPRAKWQQHEAAHTIYEAEHYQNSNFPQKRSDNIFSFIPLFEEKGEFLLLDIYPLIQDLDELDLIRKIRNVNIQNKLFRIDFISMKILKYLFEYSSLLVTQTTSKGVPIIDKSLSSKYSELNYGRE